MRPDVWKNEILMLLRAGKKRAKEVSLFEPIGTDKDGENSQPGGCDRNGKSKDH